MYLTVETVLYIADRLLLPLPLFAEIGEISFQLFALKQDHWQ